MRTDTIFRAILAIVFALAWAAVVQSPANLSAQGGVETADTTSDLVFIHHSCGSNWLGDGLHDALVNKTYIDERNDITYGTTMSPDSGRPASLGGTPGDSTNMNHWILWFNDYLDHVKAHGAATGFNKIIMFKSCYPISDVTSDGTEPGSPFSGSQTIANYKAVYRHFSGPGSTYPYNGYTYRPLEDIFAANPDVLFIPVTAPPLCFADESSDADAHRARLFNNWLKTDWLNSYNVAHPGLNNVAVFDWFNVLAYPDDHATHPNRLKQEYGGDTGNSHPNDTANAYSTQLFATNTDNFIDAAWNKFIGSAEGTGRGIYASPGAVVQGETVNYTIIIKDFTSTVNMTSTVPSGLSYQIDSLAATSGTVDQSHAPTLYWSGNLSAGTTVTITYRATVTTPDCAGIQSQVEVSSPDQETEIWETVIVANGLSTYLPVINKE